MKTLISIAALLASSVLVHAQTVDINVTAQTATNNAVVTSHGAINGGSSAGSSTPIVNITTGDVIGTTVVGASTTPVNMSGGAGNTLAISATGAANSMSATFNLDPATAVGSPSVVNIGGFATPVTQTATNSSTGAIDNLGGIAVNMTNGAGNTAAISSTGAINSANVTVNRR